MSPGDPAYVIVSLLMLLAIAALGGVPAWLLLRRTRAAIGKLVATAWVLIPIGLVLAGFGDPHDFLRFFALPAFVAGWAGAAVAAVVVKPKMKAGTDS